MTGTVTFLSNCPYFESSGCPSYQSLGSLDQQIVVPLFIILITSVKLMSLVRGLSDKRIHCLLTEVLTTLGNIDE